MVRGAIHPHLPQGDHARPWRRWLSEMQMLLHEHPANAARAAQGRSPVTGVWIAEGGVLARIRTDSARDPRVYAAAGRAGDVARGIARAGGRAATPVPADFAALAAGEDALVVLPPLASASDLAAHWPTRGSRRPSPRWSAACSRGSRWSPTRAAPRGRGRRPPRRSSIACARAGRRGRFAAPEQDASA